MELLITMALGLVLGGVLVLVLERWGLLQRNTAVTQASDVVADSIAELVIDKFGMQLNELRDLERVKQRKLELEAELAELRREKEEIETTFAQRERTLEHAAGLLRKELDQELAAARATADHEAERRILEVEREFNKRQMEFAEERFRGELKTLSDLVETLTERLPDVSARMKLEGKV